MRIRWTPPAVEDLRGISEYLRDNYPQFRRSTMTKIYRRIQELRDHPRAGRPAKAGTRELLFVPMPYIVSYRIGEGIIEILRIGHTSRKSQ